MILWLGRISATHCNSTCNQLHYQHNPVNMSGSDFGRYGVLRFMRRHEETIVASYPIDQDELTFGCDPSCSVRLYYPTVSPLHAKIIFQERKVGPSLVSAYR
jgi:hypothetical protein